MRLRNWLGYGAALLLASACGDDGDPTVTPDSGTTPDAQEEPDAIEPPVAGFTTPESGMIYFERVINAEADPDDEFIRATVNFVEPMMAAGAPAPGVCIDAWYETTEYWPAKWPSPDETVSLDVGQVTIQADDHDPFVQTPYPIVDDDGNPDTPTRDFLARQNDLAIADKIDGADALAIMGDGDMVFDVSVAGSDSYPATTWEDQLYVPSLPTLTPAPEEQIDLTATNDAGELILTYTAGANENLPEGELPLNFVGFAKAGEGGPAAGVYPFVVCLSTTDTITIPAETVQKLIDENALGAVRGQLVHNIIYMDEEDPDAGRFDLVGANCYTNTIAPIE